MSTSAYDDRAKAVRDFDESKLGVKGLLDGGLTTIPRFFHHDPSSLSGGVRRPTAAPLLSIPTVDLSVPHPRAVELVGAAARDWGCFRVINHGVPPGAIADTLSAARAFYELPAETRAAYYTRDRARGVLFNSNFDLYRSRAASWRDTLQVLTSPEPLDAEKIPAVCRRELLAWDGHALGVARRAMGLLSEGLGVAAGRLEGLSCLEGRAVVAHYYPRCPQPELTMGIPAHTDPGVLTVLVQNDVGGLLVREGSEAGGGGWVEVDPVPGAIFVNVGDALQVITNGEYRSAEHMVVANRSQKLRVSVAAFFIPGRGAGESATCYAPLEELVSPAKPARYRGFTAPELARAVASRELRPRSLVDLLRIPETASRDDPSARRKA